LLASPHYGERWGRYWLDVARFGEDQAHTFKARRYPQGYLYRDWVVNSFNTDLPYDRFLTLQIAGDLLDEPDQYQRLAALGLFALGPVYYQDNGEKDKALADEWDDRVDTLIRGTQALTISCARCHDHKYDPISMSDYYGLLGIFASTDYQERPAVPDEVVRAKSAAEARVKECNLVVNQFLTQQSRRLRGDLAAEIPNYVDAAVQVVIRRQKEPNQKKRIASVAKEHRVSEELLTRWVTMLEENRAPAEVLAQFDALRNLQSNITELKLQTGEVPDATLAEIHAAAESLQRQVTAILPQREQLFRVFGENAAFVADADLAEVVPGIIPLGNLFDDAAGVTLQSAVATDTFKATASENSLGVHRIATGWGHVTAIAPEIQFNFASLGSDERAHGAVINDAWFTQGGIRTSGKNSPSNLPRTEQGIGMHANALITFDLDEIRRAGLIPADRPMRFLVDRAGINDDAFGSGASAHLAVLVTRPASKPEVYDSIISATLNGDHAVVSENDQIYSIAGTVPDPLKADGRFAAFDVEVPAEAKWLTLVSAGAGMPVDNPISSDHVVFSGARLEYEPDASELAATNGETADTESIKVSSEARGNALLLSLLLADKGLLAIPADDVEPYLSGDPRADLSVLQQRRDEEKKAADAVQVVMAHSLTEGTGRDLPIYLAGDPQKKGDVAPRAFPAIYTSGQRRPFDSEGSGRLSLAAAITSPANPLTARVMVNRIWAGHFGFGLVRTLSNFGQLGERPTHPELLDWLAVHFVESGWSIKTLHREIMLSAAYRQSSQFRSTAFEQDPENRLLWRMNRRRLEVEPWRDALLEVSGNLNHDLGGPSSQLSDAGNRRRTLYGFVSRHELDDLLRLFDFPDPNITAGRRTVTTVPLQLLFVLNSEFMINQARALAARMQTESNSEPDRIRRAYQLAFNREPTDLELQEGLAFLNQTESKPAGDLSLWEQYALALLGSNEFSFVD
ncbi:MAG: DUF1553 domain-containing protein, partial [Planctomycetaceae bacterium]|nr:DUF1553 domain-containing protein [Planctomycetaceae bacterium]